MATSAVIRDLGFAINGDRSMATQVANACRSAYYHLYRISRIRDKLTTDTSKCLMHAFITSRIDYSSAMLYGISDRLLHRLELVQHSAARVVYELGGVIDIARQDLTRFNKNAIPNNKFQMVSGQRSHWLIESPTMFLYMCSPPLSNICQFYFKTY